MISEFILAQAAKSMWEHEQNKVMDAIMYAKEKDRCKTEAELVEASFVLGASAALEMSAAAAEIIKDKGAKDDSI